MTEERRGLTVGGQRLREALSTIATAEAAATGGASVVFYGVADKDGAEIGVARLDSGSWSLQGAVRVAVRDGRLDPGVQVVFRRRL